MALVSVAFSVPHCIAQREGCRFGLQQVHGMDSIALIVVYKHPIRFI